MGETCALRASGDERKSGEGDDRRARARDWENASAARDAMAGAPRIWDKDE